MQVSVARLLLWTTAYVVLAIAPLAIAVIESPPPRPFLVEVAAGLGFAGLSMMALQFVLTGRFRSVAVTLGLDSMLQYHRQVGLIAAGLIFTHPALLTLADAGYLDYLDPRADVGRALGLSVALTALAFLVASTLWRRLLRLPYEWWRLLHGVFALLVVTIGVIHILAVGFSVSSWWKQVLWTGLTVAAALVLVNTRLLRPLLLRRRPYRLTVVHPERGNAWTLVFEPRGHPGLRFKPGQYAWLTIADSPFSLQQHPFSFSSSADEHASVAFTIKALGDFSATAGNQPPGALAYIEGPYGAFTPDAQVPASNFVFVAGGVGITPIMSMLRTFAARRDPRSMLLIYGNGAWENVLFREELLVLQQHLRLKTVHVIERPPDDWVGESGRITPGLLDRYLPKEPLPSTEYFLCGPGPMMDLVTGELQRQGISLRHVRAERFDIV